MKTFRKYVGNIVVLAIGLVCVFLLSTSFKNTNVNPEKPITHTVIIHQMKFDPESITVKKGDIIEWINKDMVAHDITEISRKWTSKPLNQGDKFSKVITNDVNYFCSIHVVMKGSVTVTGK